ncbi:uncharacterized protein LOC133526458 [Cydia pomonella]|uniref:uncharacterized protein LOC133526458 n=1 Tax=Cydia pomonella TaxID=82600 RepID=UPI002ADD6539|nr:uncharacterized protein LOC133526458 [Cydia pomonella]
MFFLILFILHAICDAAPGHYECGVHGRFEYCIDDFPGCVVGCHCYPGYYFDTDSKICEPNTKLTQDYRRHMTPTGYTYGSSSALVHPVVPSPPPVVTASTAEPAQDSDNGDLSDWLYNQFFKTIESQVVNKTDDEPLKTGTRRSGAPIESFLTRRHNNRKRKSKKRSSRKKTIRDDDEDSEEESSSSSDSSDSDSDDSRGDLGSWERIEWGPRPSPPNGPPGAEKDGAHRQIVMFSKKPKPPLPSFIFLPNMGTAFFPPLGLPAPPIPMYPLVPIPPIPQGPPDYSENGQTTVAASMQQPTTSAPTTPTGAATPSPAPTTASPPAPSTTAPTDTQTDVKKVLRTHKLLNTFRPPLIKNRNKPQTRQVFKPSPLPPMPPMDYPMKPYVQEDDYSDMFMGDNNFLFEQGDKMDAGPDFKYISELIHRNTNESNKSTSKPPNMVNPRKHEQFQGIKPPIPKRRHPITPGRLDYPTRRRFDSKKNKEDDSYYSTLGKQIAKLIRGLDSADVLRANIKIEPAEDPKTAHPFFSENSYAARTYWERFVRSPLSLRLQNFTKYEDLIASNENLYELENQVQGATSAPVLSWLELENVINTMGAIRNQIHGRTIKNHNDKLSNVSLNVSLLPRFSAKNVVSQKPKIKTKDYMLFAEFDDVIGKLARSNKHPNLSNKGFNEKTEELNKQSKNGRNITLVNKVPGSIHLNTNIHVLRSVVSTLKPIFLTSHKKGKKDAVIPVKKDHDNVKIDYFNKIDNKPHMFQASTFVRSKKYFFDSGANTDYQFEKWAID